MIALDTNILIRYFTGDNAKQHESATSLIEKCQHSNTKIFICNIVLCELIWSLSSGNYKYSKAQLCDVLQKLLDSKEIEIEKYQVVSLALDDYRIGNADFSDYLIARLSIDGGANKLYSFDKKAAKHKYIELIK